MAVRVGIVATTLALAVVAGAGVAVAGEDEEDVGGAWSAAVGFARFDLSELNAVLEDAGQPVLPRDGLSWSWGTMVAFGGFEFGGGATQATFESISSAADGHKLSRLSVETGQIHLMWTLGEAGPVRLLAGGGVGLSSVALETYSGRTGSLSTMNGTRWTRYMLSLEPVAAVRLWVTPEASLEVRAGYTLCTDFWNTQWARADASVVDMTPGTFRGATLRLVASLGSI